MQQSFYRKIVFRLLNNMQEGRLVLTLGESEKYEFGNGNEVNADISVNDERFFKRIVLHGDIGFGEAYMERLWDTSNLTNVISWMIMNINNLPGMSGSQKRFNPINLLRLYDKFIQRLKPNSLDGSRKNISAHYDLSNDFFQTFLDPTMTYSSALFNNQSESLEEAQRNKYESLCQSLKLSGKDHVLEIGCGWGGFAIYAASNYGSKVTGITISQEQYTHAKELVESAGLEDKIEILFKDYRKVEGKFDKIVSIEMIEAVGHKYFYQYFKKISEVLKPGGVLGLQAIIIADNRYEQYRKGADWIRKHIFPGGLLPSINKINEMVTQTSSMNLYSLKEMGVSYATTLRNWFTNFHNNLPTVSSLGFDETFIRKWEYYLCSCEASFKERNINVVQMIYAHPNNPEF